MHDPQPTRAPRLSDRQCGVRLALGIGAILVAALTPVPLRAGPPAPWTWAVWLATLAAAVTVARRAGMAIGAIGTRVCWLLPVAAFFTVPAAWLAPTDAPLVVAAALVCRAWSAAALGAALATALGPAGMARGVRGLGAPARLADVFEATLASLSNVMRHTHAMLRAREARRPGFGAWASLLSDPLDTVRGFGRLVAALLLRALERAEAVEQARRARGGGA